MTQINFVVISGIFQKKLKSIWEHIYDCLLKTNIDCYDSVYSVYIEGLKSRSTPPCYHISPEKEKRKLKTEINQITGGNNFYCNCYSLRSKVEKYSASSLKLEKAQLRTSNIFDKP